MKHHTTKTYMKHNTTKHILFNAFTDKEGIEDRSVLNWKKGGKVGTHAETWDKVDKSLSKQKEKQSPEYLRRSLRKMGMQYQNLGDWLSGKKKRGLTFIDKPSITRAEESYEKSKAYISHAIHMNSMITR